MNESASPQTISDSAGSFAEASIQLFISRSPYANIPNVL